MTRRDEQKPCRPNGRRGGGRRLLLTTTLLLVAAVNVSAQGQASSSEPKPSLGIYGFAQADAIADFNPTGVRTACCSFGTSRCSGGPSMGTRV